MGEMNMDRHFYSPSLAVGPVIRYRFNPRHSLRLNGIYGYLRGDPDDLGYRLFDPDAERFSTAYIDFSLHTEFNFFPYKIYNRKDKWTPYVTGGAGYNQVVRSTASNAKNSVILSFGGGFKLTLSRRVAAGTEWTFKKTFSDTFDGQANPGKEFNTFFHNNDWYSLVGVFVTYKFWEYLEDCPAYD